MLVLTLALIFTMAGCMRSEDTLVLNADGSGSSTTLLEVKKSAYDEIVKEMGIGQETNLFGDETPTVVTKDGGVKKGAGGKLSECDRDGRQHSFLSGCDDDAGGL